MSVVGPLKAYKKHTITTLHSWLRSVIIKLRNMLVSPGQLLQAGAAYFSAGLSVPIPASMSVSSLKPITPVVLEKVPVHFTRLVAARIAVGFSTMIFLR